MCDRVCLLSISFFLIINFLKYREQLNREKKALASSMDKNLDEGDNETGKKRRREKDIYGKTNSLMFMCHKIQFKCRDFPTKRFWTPPPRKVCETQIVVHTL